MKKTASEKKKKLAVLMLQYNSAHLTIQLLDSIEKHEALRLQDYRFVLMDNESAESNFIEISQRFPWVELVPYKENLGFGRAHNRLMPTIQEDWVLLLNNDCILLNDAVTRTLLKAESHCADFATCTVLNEDLSDQANFSTLPSPLRRIFLNLSGITRLLWHWRRWRQVARVGYINGAFLLLRKSAIPQKQLFDDRYFMYTEDLDLMIRLAKERAKGYRFASGKVIHLGGCSAARKWTIGQINESKAQQANECFRRHYPTWQLNFQQAIYRWIRKAT
jgi:GT2 family glycosyltransferase